MRLQKALIAAVPAKAANLAAFLFDVAWARRRGKQRPKALGKSSIAIPHARHFCDLITGTEKKKVKNYFIANAFAIEKPLIEALLNSIPFSHG